MREVQPLSIEQLEFRQQRIGNVIAKRQNTLTDLDESIQRESGLYNLVDLVQRKMRVDQSAQRLMRAHRKIAFTIEAVGFIPEAREYLEIDQRKQKLNQLREFAPKYISLEKVEEQEIRIYDLEIKVQKPAFQAALEMIRRESEPRGQRRQSEGQKETLEDMDIYKRMDGTIFTKGQVGRLVNILEREYSREHPAEFDDLVRKVLGDVTDASRNQLHTLLYSGRKLIAPEGKKIVADKLGRKASLGEKALYFIEVPVEESSAIHIRPETFETLSLLLDKPDTNLEMLIGKMGLMVDGKRYSRGTAYKALGGSIKLAERNLQAGVANEEEQLIIDEVDRFVKARKIENREGIYDWLKNKFEIAATSAEGPSVPPDDETDVPARYFGDTQRPATLAEQIDYSVVREDKAVLNLIEKFNDYILYEDDHLLILNKPAGVNSHWSLRNPIGVEEIACAKVGGPVALAHRIDRNTTGVLVLTKTPEAYENLRKQFANKTENGMKKIYLALLDGELNPKDQDRIEVNVPITNTETDRMRVVKPDESYDQNARDSQTFLTPIAILKDQLGVFRTLTQVQITTGRTHQIRVIAADALGHPVTGDRLYNSNSRGVPRQMLHAYELTFKNPATNKQMTIQAPVPADFSYSLSRLSWEY